MRYSYQKFSWIRAYAEFLHKGKARWWWFENAVCSLFFNRD